MIRNFACLVFAFVLFQTLVFAESRDWNNVKRYKKGESISILKKSGGSLDAEIEKVEDTKILVKNKRSRFEVVLRDDISKIYRNGIPLGKSIWRGILIGAASGFVVGLIAESQYTGADDVGLATIMFTASGAPIGAGMGALQSLSSRKLIYNSDTEKTEQAAVKIDSPYCGFSSLRSGAGAD